jgi:DNA-binding Xre family transcriptional regulator
MQARGLTQLVLADATGISPTTISKLSRGHFDRIDVKTTTTLCKHFGFKSISDLIEIEWEASDNATKPPQ